MITMKAISKFRMMKALSDDDENCDNGIDYDTYINFQHIRKGKTTDIFVNIFDLILFMPERGNLKKVLAKKQQLKVFGFHSTIFVGMNFPIYRGLCCLRTILAEVCLYLISQHPGPITSLAYIQFGSML